MAELKPCPFCGGKAAIVPRAVNIALQKDPSDPKFGVSVICGRCGAESANYLNEEYAATAWNRRTESSGGVDGNG
jgi:Lar family restriction alleviation protein